MQLYGALGSPYVARVVLFARLKGLDLATAPPEGGTRSPAFLAMNPFGKVPVLEHEGVYTPESSVICALLDDLYPDRPGLEGTPPERARARTIERLYDLYVAPQASILFANLDPSTRQPEAVASAKSAFADAWLKLAHFVTAPYAAGRKVSLADCALLPAIGIYRKTVFPALEVPDPTSSPGKLQSWWRALTGHPLTGPFIGEYDAAVDALLAAFRQR